MRAREPQASGLYKEKEAGSEAARKALRGLQPASRVCGEGPGTEELAVTGV